VPAGRPAKPTALKKIEGHPNKRMLERKEPMPLVKDQTCPAILDSIGKTEWKRIVPELERLGLLTMADRSAITGYCVAFSKWIKAEQVLKDGGMVYKITKTDRNGNPVSDYFMARPEVFIAHQMASLILKYCTEFGLTPSSRVRLSAGKKVENDSEMEDLLD
jgi:P27 family predicted phage terminase small subunit